MLTLSHCTNHGPLKSNGRHGPFGKHIESGAWPELRRCPHRLCFRGFYRNFFWLHHHRTIGLQHMVKACPGTFDLRRNHPNFLHWPQLQLTQRPWKKAQRWFWPPRLVSGALFFFLAPTLSDTVVFCAEMGDVSTVVGIVGMGPWNEDEKRRLSVAAASPVSRQKTGLQNCRTFAGYFTQAEVNLLKGDHSMPMKLDCSSTQIANQVLHGTKFLLCAVPL